MKNVFVINKKEGETPLEALEVFRRKKKIDKEVPMTYAGRLDPMASGLMILLAGDECKNKNKYLGLDKEYEFEVLFGFETDTYDILGKIIHSNILTNIGMKNLEKEIKKNLIYFKDKFMQKYPMYSSRTVDGVPLFAHARAGKVVESPEHEVHVKSLKFLKFRKISALKLLQNIEKRIGKVIGDFRQKEILNIWRRELGAEKMPKHFFCASFSARVSSGTYIRVIAHDLGERIGLPALAFKIKRTKVGKYDKLI